MKTFNIHAGHGLSGGQGCGAVGILDESDEARKVKDCVIQLLKQNGYMVYDCTYNGNASPNVILSYIVSHCNQNSVDLDISIHLNSGRGDYNGDGSTGGVEVYGYNTDVKNIGENICNSISSALGIRNRGFKINKDLYILRKTRAKAILIECCFVDDKDDSDHWNAIKCAEAIYTALTGNNVIKTKNQLHFRGHVQGIGWDKVQASNYIAGTTGQSKRLEAIKIDYPGHTVQAKAHIQGIGDVDYGTINSNTIIGTTGQSKRLEALWLKGDLEFRVHIQNIGWTEWVNAKNGAWLGTKGKSLRIEAVQIREV